MKLLVDANFLIDYYARRDEFFDSCTTLLVAESFHDVELWAPAKSFTDVFYVLNQRLKVEGSLVQRALISSNGFPLNLPTLRRLRAALGMISKIAWLP